MNPFNKNSTPLDPYHQIIHEKYYADVDKTRDSFDCYKNYLKSLSNILESHAVLFCGETGCGKTSLMNRCLNSILKMEWLSNNDSLKYYLINLSYEKMSDLGAREKVSSIIELISLELYNNYNNTIPLQIAETFAQRIKNSSNQVILRYLETELSRLKIYPIFIFPSIETEADLKEYVASFYRRSWILYFETENLNVIDECRKNYSDRDKIHILKLEVGSLKENDGIKFVEQRLSILEKKQNVEFDYQAIEEYLKQRKIKFGVSIKELEIICHTVYEKALKSNSEKQIINFEEIAKAALTILKL